MDSVDEEKVCGCDVCHQLRKEKEARTKAIESASLIVCEFSYMQYSLLDELVEERIEALLEDGTKTFREFKRELYDLNLLLAVLRGDTPNGRN